jgi:hypothetical protein
LRFAVVCEREKMVFKTNVRMIEGYREKKRRKGVRERQILTHCGNGNVSENVSCLLETKRQEELHRA